jgi:transcriptional repressor NrdR
LDRGDREIKASDVGAMVMEELKRLDEIAYVRFASVYRQFRDINEFMDELKELLLKKDEA